MPDIIEPTGKICSDLPGKFPLKYFRGNISITAMYDYDIDVILIQEIQNREGQSIVNEYDTLYNSLSTKGQKPRLKKIYNEASSILIQSLQD